MRKEFPQSRFVRIQEILNMMFDHPVSEVMSFVREKYRAKNGDFLRVQFWVDFFSHDSSSYQTNFHQLFPLCMQMTKRDWDVVARELEGESLVPGYFAIVLRGYFDIAPAALLEVLPEGHARTLENMLDNGFSPSFRSDWVEALDPEERAHPLIPQS